MAGRHATETYVNEAVSNATSATGGIVTRSTGQSIPNATLTAVEFNAEQFDSGSFVDIAGNPTRLTAPAGEGGIYIALATCEFDSNATGNQRGWHLRINGSTYVSIDTREPIATKQRAAPSAAFSLVAGDYIELLVYQDSGGSLSVMANIVAPRMSLLKIGDAA